MAYSPAPMVLIMTDGGERIWWKADLVDLVAADNPGRCACDNDFDGDNLCMPSACQWEGIEHPQERCATSHIHDAVCDQDEIGDWWHPVSRSGN